MNPSRYGSLISRALRTVIAKPSATTTTLKALAADAPSRADGAITVVLADSSVWVFDADSAAGSQDGVLVPDAGTGRWLLLGVPGQGAGVDYKGSVRAASTAAIAAYTRTANVILANANGALAAQDGVTLVVGDRYLLKNGAAGADNGIWVMDAAGAAGAKYQFTRAEDMASSADVTAGALVYVSEGTVNGNAWFMLTTDDAITLNTTALTFTKLPTLADLAATTTGLGAALVGVVDADAVITATTVDTALVELAKRVLGTYATEAAIKAIVAAQRTNGAIAVDATNDVAWIFDSGSAAGASAWVLVPDAGTGRWLRNHPSLADLSAVTAGNGASLVGLEDAGGFTAATTVEAAAAELYQDIASVQKQLWIPATAWVDADGDPLVKFVDGAFTVPGFNLADGEAFGIRWNNHGTPDPMLTALPMPQDLDDAANVVLHIMASKTGATLADAVTFAVTAFFVEVGALHDADVDCGGTSSAMVGDAVAKTVAELTLTLALADVPPSPSVLALTIQPTDGTLGTDDVIIHGVWLEYKGKLLTS